MEGVLDGLFLCQPLPNSGLSKDDEETDVGSDRALWTVPDLVCLVVGRLSRPLESGSVEKGDLNVNLAPGLETEGFCTGISTGIKALGLIEALACLGTGIKPTN